MNPKEKTSILAVVALSKQVPEGGEWTPLAPVPALVLRIKKWSSVIISQEQMFKGLENNFMINTPKAYYQFPLLVKA